MPCCEAPLALAKRGSEASAPNYAGAEMVSPFGDSLAGGCQGKGSPEGETFGGGRAAAPSTRGAERGTPGPGGSAGSVAGRGERAGRRAACAERQARPGRRRAGGVRVPPKRVARAGGTPRHDPRPENLTAACRLCLSEKGV